MRLRFCGFLFCVAFLFATTWSILNVDIMKKYVCLDFSLHWLELCGRSKIHESNQALHTGRYGKTVNQTSNTS